MEVRSVAGPRSLSGFVLLPVTWTNIIKFEVDRLPSTEIETLCEKHSRRAS